MQCRTVCTNSAEVDHSSGDGDSFAVDAADRTLVERFKLAHVL